jgi:hypothetical protein
LILFYFILLNCKIRFYSDVDILISLFLSFPLLSAILKDRAQLRGFKIEDPEF